MTSESDILAQSRRHALTALRHRNFRLIWFGQLISGVGGQMQQVAVAWHLYDLTGSSFQVGLVAFFRIAPFIVLSFVGGAIAEYVSGRPERLRRAIEQVRAEDANLLDRLGR